MTVRGWGALAAMMLASAPVWGQSVTTSSGAPSASSASPSSADASPAPDGDLGGLEQLLNTDLKVFSASKKSEDLSDASAAIYVVTADEIRRSGATSLPETLRVVPGLEVGRFNAWTWAISARGFSGQFNNKMLALIDGRTIYSPLFGGVFWDAQDYFLPDLERIEVIRGPGGTLWGANAVNGVINITTRSAFDTQGLRVTQLGGTFDRYRGGVRYGGELGDLAWRVWGQYFVTGPSVLADGSNAPDAWRGARGGLRADWRLAGGSLLTIEGDTDANHMNTEVEQPIPVPPYSQRTPGTSHTNGANVLARYTRPVGEGQFQAQAYWDYEDRFDPRGQERRNSTDLELQLHHRVGGNNDLVAGVGMRSTAAAWTDSPFVALSPTERTDLIYDAFLQDDLLFARDRVHVTAGSKLEHNDFTGVEVQPTVRASARLGAGQTAWAAVSRAVRTPSRIEHDAEVFYGIFPGPIYAYAQGAKNLSSTNVISVEGGWRSNFGERASLDLALFDNWYEKFILIDPVNAGTPVQQPDGSYRVEVPFSNGRGGRVLGAELSGQVILTPQLTASASWTHTEEHLFKWAVNNVNDRPAPRDQASFRLYASVTEAVDYTLAVYYADTTGSATGVGAAITPAWARMDMGVMGRPTKHLEISVWAQNILQDQHPEIITSFLFPTAEVPRSFYASASVQF